MKKKTGKNRALKALKMIKGKREEMLTKLLAKRHVGFTLKLAS